VIQEHELNQSYPEWRLNTVAILRNRIKVTPTESIKTGLGSVHEIGTYLIPSRTGGHLTFFGDNQRDGFCMRGWTPIALEDTREMRRFGFTWADPQTGMNLVDFLDRIVHEHGEVMADHLAGEWDLVTNNIRKPHVIELAGAVGVRKECEDIYERHFWEVW
jgi:hypothetical protein